MRIVVLILILSSLGFAQTDWKRWQKVDVSYSIKSIGVEENHSYKKSTSTLAILKDGYSFLISDLDGDNCPFYPTCSSFYVKSVSQTNIIKGTLMFADRFTRDSNLFKTREHYATHISGRLYDPIKNYLLTDSTIIYSSRDEFIK